MSDPSLRAAIDAALTTSPVDHFVTVVAAEALINHIARAVSGLVREAKAEAWDEGVLAERAVECNCWRGTEHTCGPINPYRSET